MFLQPLLWDEEEIVTKIEAFRREYIDKDIIDTEKQEKSMHEYLMVLHKFAFNQVSVVDLGSGFFFFNLSWIDILAQVTFLTLAFLDI